MFDKPLPVPEFRPDQSIFSNVLLTCDGVFPSLDGYRPVGAITEISDALGSGDFLGGYSAIAADGDAYFLAGTTSNLYSLTSAGSWTSLVGSLSISNRWKFAQFGDYVVAVNGSATREVDLNAGTESTISGAPTFTDIAVVGDFVVGARPNGDINSVQWSSFRDHTAWVSGTNQAGDQPMLTGGAVQAIAGGEYGVIFQRERIVRMTRTGDAAAPFQFDEISVNYGCADGATVAQSGRTVFFYSDRGFMAIDDGQVLKNIGSEKVDRSFLEETARDNLSTIYTAVDPANKLVMWGVPGTPGKLWIYNFELDRWSTAEINFKGVFPGFTTSYTTDDLASLGYVDVDDVAILVDDPRWSGGEPRLYLISEDSKAANLSGNPVRAEFEYGYTAIEPDILVRPRSVRPMIDATSGLTLKMNAKARIGDTDNITSQTTLRQSGVMPIRGKGRFHKFRIIVAAGTDWSNFGGISVEYTKGGRR